MVTKSTVEGNTNNKRNDEQTNNGQVTQTHAAPEMNAAIDPGLADIFVDIHQTALPIGEISAPFEEAFFAYTQMSEKDFLGEVEHALLKLATKDSGPDFLNLEFEQLFDIQVEEGGSSVARAISSGSEGSVVSLERSLEVDPFKSEEGNEIFVQSQPQVLSFNTNQVYAYSVAPAQSPNLSENGPKTPPLFIPPPTSQIPLTEANLNSQPNVIIQSNIFIPSIYNNFNIASTGAGLLTMDVFFNFPARAGSSEIHTPSLTTLTTPEGNIFSFNRITGDFSYQLNDTVTHLQSVWGPNYVNALQDIFTDRFVYAITDVALQTAVGNISVFIVDDVPKATDQTTVAITEADILTIGSNQSAVPEQLPGSLISLPNNSFGADGGSVTNVTLPGGTTSISLGVITVTDPAGNTLVINQATGSYAYNLINPFTNINNQPTVLVFTFTFTDNDLDTVTKTITFTINDDTPVAFAQNAGSANEADISAVGSSANPVNPTISGDITSGATTVGADGGTVTNVILTSALSNGSSVATAITTIVAGVMTVTDSEGNVLVVNPDGIYNYTLNNAYSNNNNLPTILTYTYTLTDNDGSTASSTLIISINDDGPVALPQNGGSLNESDIVTVGSDADLVAPSITGDITSGGTLLGADGGTVTNVILTSALSNGSSVATASTSINAGVITVTDSEGNKLVVNPDGTYTLTLNDAYSNNGNQPTILTYSYTLTDGDGTTASATLSFTINDDSPIANARTNAVDETALFVNGPGSETATGNLINELPISLYGADGGKITSVNGQSDTDADGIIIANSEYGTITVYVINIGMFNAGDYIYTLDSSKTSLEPDSQLNVVDNISYVITDGDGSTSTSSLDITVDLNQAPTANPDTASTTENAAVLVNVLANDNPNDAGDTLTLTQLLSVSATYGIIPITLTTAQASIVSDQISFDPGSDFNFLAQDEVATVVVTYEIKDAEGLTSTSTATITIEGTNDAPVANDQAINATEDGPPVGPIAFAADDIDSDDNQASLTYTIINNVAAGEGSVTNNGNGTFTFNPGSDFQALAEGQTQDVTFTYKATDAHGVDSGEQTVTITVTGVNDVPIADPVSASGDEDTASILVSLSGSDIDGTVTNFRVDVLPSNGLLYTDPGLTNLLIAGSLIAASGESADLYFVPDASFNGNVQFNYVAIDDQNADSTSALVDITINPVNDAPLADPVSASGDEDAAAILVSLSGSDIDGTVTNFRVDVLPSNGLLYTDPGLTNLLIAGSLIAASGESADLYFVPDANFNGNVQFDYLAVDNQNADSLPTQANITVNPVNDAPLAVDDSYSIPSGNTITGTAGVDGLLQNDSDPENDTLTIIAINGLPTLTGIMLVNGTLDVGADGSFNYSGTVGQVDTFNYTISDGNGGEDIAQVSLSVGVPPMILDLNNNNKIDLIDADHSGVTLNSFSDTHGTNQMGWVQPGDGILVYDYQGDGKVTNIDEIALTFHSEEAKTDLDALRLAFDTNHDGIFDAKDEKFDKFGVWQDKNSDGKSDMGEYQTLTQMGILSINLSSDHQVQMIEGNTVFGYSSYQTMDGVSHVAGDVSLSVSPATKSAALNVPDVIGEHDGINFSSLASAEAPLPALATDNVSLVSQAAPSESAAEMVATSVAMETQHITQQLQSNTQEHS